MVQQDEGHPACKNLSTGMIRGGGPTVTLHVLQVPAVTTAASIISRCSKGQDGLTFRYRLTQPVLENWPLKQALLLYLVNSG